MKYNIRKKPNSTLKDNTSRGEINFRNVKTLLYKETLMKSSYEEKSENHFNMERTSN